MKHLFITLSLLFGAISANGQQPAAPSKLDYKTFISKDGRFSVLLPSRPTINKEDPTTSAAAGASHVFLWTGSDFAYYISYTDFKPEELKAADISKVLDGARDGGVANSKGKLVNEKKIELDGYPGREILIDLPGEPKTNARARFYLASNRLYAVIFAGPAPAANGPDTDRFLASLKLIRPTALPAAWIMTDSKEGNFRFKMPAKPELSVEDAGSKQPVHLWQLVTTKSEAAYFAAYNDLGAQVEKSDDIENALDKGIDAVAKSLSATIEAQSMLSVDGYPGREVTMKIGAKDPANSGLCILRAVIVRDRYYQMMAIGTKSAMDHGRIDDFMASFELTLPEPKPSK